MFLKPFVIFAVGVITFVAAEVFAYAQPATAEPTAPAVSLSSRVKSLTETVQTLEKRIQNLENQTIYNSAALIPGDTKLQSIRSGSAVFLMSIDKPQATADGSEFTLTVVNPQAITYTNINFDIRIFGKDANGNPQAYKTAHLLSRITPAFDAGTSNTFKFAVKGVKPDNFAAAYVATVTFGSVAASSAE